MNNYRKIWEDNFGPIPKDENGRSYEIHHKDGNAENNDLSNLMCVSIKEHYDIHYKQKDWLACSLISHRMGISTFSGYKLKPLSEETKNKIKQKLIGRNISEETKQKISKSSKGRIFSKEHKRKIAEKSKGNKACFGMKLWWPNGRSEEVKKKISDKNKIKSKGENNGMYGKKHSPETIEKLRLAKIGKPNIKSRGRKMSDETKQKLRSANLGKNTLQK